MVADVVVLSSCLSSELWQGRDGLVLGLSAALVHARDHDGAEALIRTTTQSRSKLEALRFLKALVSAYAC